jgi:hypothetical protein
MDLSTFIVSVFCLIDDRLKGERIRRRGPAPKLSDSEVITMEVVGEFLGIDTDKAIHLYFGRHYPHYFPGVREVHRTTFARQAANLWKAKEHLSGNASLSKSSRWEASSKSHSWRSTPSRSRFARRFAPTAAG